MAAGEGDCEVHVVGALSGEVICTLRLPASSLALEVKSRVQSALGVNVYRQRLMVSPDGPLVEDHEVLATLPGLRLGLVRLEYVEDDPEGSGRLLPAAGKGAVAEVEHLLRLPLRPDCGRSTYGETALMRAAGEGHLAVTRLLCEAGADTDGVDFWDRTALIAASFAGHAEVVQLLCQAGANKDLPDVRGATPLMEAAKRGHMEVARLLCVAGAAKDKADGCGSTALMWASSAGHVEVVRFLLEVEAAKDQLGASGRTALMWAAEAGQAEVVRVLCEAGVDKNAVESNGKTALTLASRHADVARLLREAGAIEEAGASGEAPGP